MKGCQVKHCAEFGGCLRVRNAFKDLTEIGVAYDVDKAARAAEEGETVRVELSTEVQIDPAGCLMLSTDPDKVVAEPDKP